MAADNQMLGQFWIRSLWGAERSGFVFFWGGCWSRLGTGLDMFGFLVLCEFLGKVVSMGGFQGFVYKFELSWCVV